MLGEDDTAAARDASDARTLLKALASDANGSPTSFAATSSYSNRHAGRKRAGRSLVRERKDC